MYGILLALSSQLRRDAVREILTEGGFSVIAETEDLSEAHEKLRTGQLSKITYAIIGCELFRYVTDDIASLRSVTGPDTKIVVLVDPTDIGLISRDHIAVVDGILTLDTSSEEMVQSLNLIRNGERIVARRVIDTVLVSLPRQPAPARPPAAEPTRLNMAGPVVHPLTARESEILRRLVQGGSNKLIAQQLGITEATVKVHFKSLLRKLGVANRTQAAIWAQTNGFGSDPTNNC